MGYRQPAPDPNGSRTGGRYKWLKCGTHQSPVASKIKIASTFKRLVIWQSVFLSFETRSLRDRVKARVRVGLK